MVSLLPNPANHKRIRLGSSFIYSGAPNGLNAISYTSEDIPALVQATLLQHRLIKLSPRQVGPDELTEIFEDAMSYW
jgi:alcohol dehydrogenase class IV